MRRVQGSVVVLESNKGVPGLTVTAFNRVDAGGRTRVGSVTTADDGRFLLEYGEAGAANWNLELEVSVDGTKPSVLYADAATRFDAGETESWSVRLTLAELRAANVLDRQVGDAALAADLPALGTFLARTVASASYDAEVQTAVRARLDPLRSAATATATLFHDELVREGRGAFAPPPVIAIGAEQLDTLHQGLAHPRFTRRRYGYVSVSEEERAAIRAAAGADGRLPAEMIEPMLRGPDDIGERTAVNLLASACRGPRTLDDACPDAAPPEPSPPPNGSRLAAIAEAVWAELQPAVVRAPERPNDADVRHRIEGLDLQSGPSDAPAIFDFHAIHIPFDDVWRDLVDDDVVQTATQLHFEVSRLGGDVPTTSAGSLTGSLRREARFLSREAPAAMRQRRFPGGPLLARGLVTGMPDPMGDEGTQWVSALLDELERKLQEPYRFTVFGADQTGSAINFGVVTTYRQVWQPLSYQAGKLVETITLTPREERTFSRKVTTSSKRRTETKEKFRSVTRSEEQSTQRAVRDIVETAEHRTGFEASGSYGPVSGSLTVDDSRTSSDTRQSFREAVRRAAAEYETDRSVDVVFESSQEIVTEQTGKLTNPNDELAITYLFYQLQRRFHVSERLHRVTPVILVAQPVPAPHEINITWILQHDWILRRVLLDPSFTAALDLVTGSLVGEESTVGMLRSNLDQQRQVVAALKDSLITAHRSSEVLFEAVQNAIEKSASIDLPLTSEAVEKVLLWIFSAESDDEKRARIKAAREELARSESNERAIAEQLQRDQSTLTVMTDRWAAASRALLDKTVEVQRLRLHIKQNILYYMQAIWDHEPPDQRYFRLHRIPVPQVSGELRYYLDEDDDAPPLPPYWTTPVTVRAEIAPPFTTEPVPLGQIADLDRPLGYKGNYAIFAMREPNLVTRYLMVPYVDRASGAHDPDHLGNLTRAELEEYYCCLKRHLSPEELALVKPGLDETHRRLLTDPRPLEDVIVVPTDALFIAALPSDQPLLEDFKLRNRAADAARAEAEAAKARLENVRRAARILAGELADPDIEKLTIIQGEPGGIVAPGEDS